MVKLFRQAPRRKRTSFTYKAPGSRRRDNERESGWRPLRLDKRLVVITLAFVMTGLVFTYSSSAFDSSAFFKRQLIFDAMGLLAALVLSQSYDRLQRLKWLRPINLMYITWILLIAVLFTRTQANVHRWIDFGFFK